MSILFAGTFSTGISSCWLHLYLHESPTWKSKVIAELEMLLERYSPFGQSLSVDKDSESLSDRLACIPPHAWDTDTPVLDACLRETIRLTMSGTFLRRALVDGIVVGGRHIEKGTFIAYPVGDVHLDGEIYPEPTRCVRSKV